MAASKKDLAQKIAVMQVANAGGLVYTKSENSQVWARTENPVFNWGISDYKIVTDYTSLLSNPENTTLNFTDLVNQLNYLERGKNLGSPIDYAEQQINLLETNVKSDISTKIDVDCAALDKASLIKTDFFKELIHAVGGDADTINDYIAEIQNIAKTTLRDSIILAANKVISQSTKELLSTLPDSDKVLYENNAPSIDDLKSIVNKLASQVMEIYPTTEDGTIIELEEKGITLRFWKNLGRENVLSVSYDLAKATVGASPEYGVKTDSQGNITYSEVEVTRSELNNAIADAISTAEFRDTVNKESILKTAKDYDNSLHEIILNDIDEKIANAKPIFLKEASENAENLDSASKLELTESIKRMVLDISYPVGSLYWSSKNTSPDTLFGGKWKRITDTFIYAAGDSDSVDTTGGSKTAALATKNLPAHSHTVTITKTDSISGSSNAYPLLYNASAKNDTTTTSAKITVTGGGNSKATGDAFNIMPPYTVKYCWERTE